MTGKPSSPRAKHLAGIASAILLLMLSVVSRAQQIAPPLTGTGPAPVGTRYVYETIDGKELALYIKRPVSRAGKPTPAIVFYHGGAWIMGDANQFNRQAEHLSSEGITAIQVQYRLISRTDPLDVPMADAVVSFAWVLAHTSELGLDPKRIAVAGGSAGGQLAGYLGMIATEHGGFEGWLPALMIFYNPVVDVGPEGCCAGHVIPDYKAISPLYHVRGGLPPTIIFHGDKDTVVSPSSIREFEQEMKNAGNVCQVIFYEGVGHSFFNLPKYEQKTTAALDSFLKTQGWPPAP